ncbi:MAG: tetratricopeptide repeat protein [Bacteroidia bacterium]
MKKRFSILFLISFYACFSQTREIDSLKRALRSPSADTLRLDLLNNLGRKLLQIGEYDSSLAYTNAALALAKRSPANLAIKRGLAKAYNNLANIYTSQGNYPEALKNNYLSLKLKEELNDKAGIANSYNNIGVIHKEQRNYEEALKNNQEALKIRQEINDKKGIAGSYNNIGNIYKNMKRYTDALLMQQAALKIHEELGNPAGVASSLGNIANIYNSLGNYAEAFNYYNQVLNINRQMGNKQGIADCYINLADLGNKHKKYKDVESFAMKSLALFSELSDLEGVKAANMALSEACNKKGDYKRSLQHYKAFIAARDSLINEENTKKTVRLEMNYEFDKKAAAARLLQEKKEAVAKAESKKQKIVIMGVSGILLVVVAFAIFVYRSYLQKQKANIEITRQKEIIEEKQKEILDSIHYARRIQAALFTPETYIARSLNRLSGKDT